MLKFFLILALSIYLHAMEVSLKDSKIANGRCFLLKSNETDFSKHYVAFEGKRYSFFPSKRDPAFAYYAIVPVDYYTKPKLTKLVAVVWRGEQKQYKSFKVNIIDGRYKSERLRVAPSKAKLSKKNKIRIARESKIAKKIYNITNPECYWDKVFKYPMDSKITSAFGNKRIFNGTLKSYHSGTDFRAKVGAPLYSVNSGKVVLVENRFFAGGSVIIDHGEGIYTCYYHMSKFSVKVGDMVGKGEKLGLAGATGRVTGPHLHFSTRVGGVQVDPLQLLELLNEI